MRYEQIQQKTINRLLDKYEKSKTFTGTNQVNQNFVKRIIELFPKYNDDAEYELFCDVNDALKDLEKSGLVSLEHQRGEVISHASLNVDKLQECYAYVRRESRKEEQDWILEIMRTFQECPVLDAYFEAQRGKISKNQKVEYFDGDKRDYKDLLQLVKELYTNEQEQFIRDFSSRLFRDSKRVERLASKACALMYQYGNYQDKESVLEECGVVKTPTYVCVKGAGVLVVGEQTIDLSKISGDIALSTASLKELAKVQITGKRVITVENLTSFHDYGGSEDFVIYLGGFHNRTKREFLKFLYEQNPNAEYRHFGDIDAGGFYILEHLKEKTRIPFASMFMDVDTIKQYKEQSKTLTVKDRERIANLLKRLEGKIEEDSSIEDYRDVLRFMLDHNCKLEQEAINLTKDLYTDMM